jgi:S-adenosylmethionine-dependent methyltransferase
MTTTAQTFDGALPAFKENQNAPWGRLRYGLSLANLQRHLKGQALRVLDVGGGNGVDAIAFARQGHTVTLLDFSSDMLAEARHKAQENGVTGRISFYQSDLTAIPTLFPPAEFDVILCHNILHYIDDVGAVLQTICQALHPNGLISIMCLNRYSEAYRQALQNLDLSAATASLEAKSIYAGTFGVSIHAYTVEDMRQPLEEAGCSLVGQYGVRCICDYIADNDIKNDPNFFAQLEQLEYALSDKYPYYLLARYFQVIARKTTI